jgi:glycosyltransferase involved in cell wall biosynthesis
MKITIVQGAFFPVPPIRGGAVEKLWHVLGVALAERGFEVTHISRREPGQADQELDGRVTRIRVRGYDWSNRKILSRLADLFYSFRVTRLLPESDILVSNTFFLPLLVREPKKGLIYVNVQRYPRRQFGLYKRASRFQCVSNAVAKALVAQCPACASRTKVVPNFVTHFIVEPLVSSYVLRENIILFVGRIHPEKGLHLLIDALSMLPDTLKSIWRLQVVGPHEARAGGGGDAYFQSLKKQAAASSFTVEWMGSIYDKEMLNDVYSKAKLFIYPSLAAEGEAFGLSPLEAMAQATPVVVSNLDCFTDFIKDGDNGWVFDAFGDNPAGDLAEILARAMMLVADSDRAVRYASAALASSQRFSLDKVVDLFIHDFKSLLNNEQTSA